MTDKEKQMLKYLDKLLTEHDGGKIYTILNELKFKGQYKALAKDFDNIYVVLKWFEIGEVFSVRPQRDGGIIFSKSYQGE